MSKQGKGEMMEGGAPPVVLDDRGSALTAARLNGQSLNCALNTLRQMIKDRNITEGVII